MDIETIMSGAEIGPKEKVNAHPEEDKELEEIVQRLETSIKIVGVGGSGCNTINRLSEMGVIGSEIVTVNADAQDLYFKESDRKVLIGSNITHGRGAGNNPKVGEECARADKSRIENALRGGDMIFVTCGLGGGTGTGAAPIVAEVAKSLNALTIAIVTLPFVSEGRVRSANALHGLTNVREHADTTIVIPNDRLLDLVPNLPLDKAFRVADELLSNAAKGITELITKPGLVNLDFADINTVMENGGTALIGIGISSTDAAKPENRAKESALNALRSPLLDTTEVDSAMGAIIHITGGPDMKLEEANTIVKTVADNIDPNAQIIWGAHIEEGAPTTHNVIKTLLILSGVKTPKFEEDLKDRAEMRPQAPVFDFDLKQI